MNTIWADTGGVHDDLTTPSALREWIAVVMEKPAKSFGVINSPDVAEARLLRDAVRRLAAFCTRDDRAAAQSAVVNIEDAISSVNVAVSHRPHAQLSLCGETLQRETPAHTPPVRTALAELANDAIDLLTGPTSEVLRACHAPGCVLYFVKGHPRREWCSEACGNRVRAARHYRRNRSQ